MHYFIDELPYILGFVFNTTHNISLPAQLILLVMVGRHSKSRIHKRNDILIPTIQVM
jgi:hypothetical protein